MSKPSDATAEPASLSLLPVGPEVDPTPRPLPARVPHRGAAVTLEPLGLRHAEELWQAVQGADDSWAYMGYGPFPDPAAFRRFLGGFATTHDPIAWAVRPHISGRALGWLTLMEIQPAHAAIELGNIWFSPRMQRSRAATEAMFLLMRHAMDDLGYRRLVWKCNALNAPSRRAAARLGFVPEGEHRAHLVVKGRRRDTAWFSILEDEWPSRRDAIAAWLAEENFDHRGIARRSLRQGQA
ncbi:GNAT family N-acetyltransferase [Teichococcus vastitatis]|uniref:GNAT family N-acetyltransferase n=1 Tax=Teichococcus vastitatis TaxID=2307076 RepID=A0ABS9WC74_9PROT|nr:GNAT family protein [Pseudoroseomonas vastitatis]MCI0756593.1 GNAT family N-acetyltransferase [Pseudoroseomonas vastitatis]